MQLATHHKFALAGALALSGVAVFDAITHGITGHWSAFSDDGDIAWVRALGSAVHGLAYAGALWVLHAERRRIHATRAATVFGWLLFAAFVPLAVGFLTAMPLQAAGIGFASYDVVTPIIGFAFVLQFVAGVGLGLSLRTRPETRPGSRILQAIIPAIGATALIAFLAPAWAHPAYAEACTILGAALLGATAPAERRTPSPSAVVKA
jgi:hypothetical protein